MNPFTAIIDFFKKTGTQSSESNKLWREGLDAYQKGEALLQNGHFQEGLASLDMAINRSYHGYGRAFSARASCLQALGFDLEAIEDFNKAIASEPQDSNLYFMRSISKSATGDLHGCVDDLQEAIRTAKLHPMANRSHDAYAKEKGYDAGVVGFYEFQLISANLDLEQQASDEKLRRESPDHPFGPDLVTRRRSQSRRRAT